MDWSISMEAFEAKPITELCSYLLQPIIIALLETLKKSEFRVQILLNHEAILGVVESWKCSWAIPMFQYTDIIFKVIRRRDSLVLIYDFWILWFFCEEKGFAAVRAFYWNYEWTGCTPTKTRSFAHRQDSKLSKTCLKRKALLETPHVLEGDALWFAVCSFPLSVEGFSWFSCISALYMKLIYHTTANSFLKWHSAGKWYVQTLFYTPLNKLQKRAFLKLLRLLKVWM